MEELLVTVCSGSEMRRAETRNTGVCIRTAPWLASVPIHADNLGGSRRVVDCELTNGQKYEAVAAMALVNVLHVDRQVPARFRGVIYIGELRRGSHDGCSAQQAAYFDGLVG